MIMEVPPVRLDEGVLLQRSRKILLRLAFRKLSIDDQMIIASLEREEFLGQFQG